MANFDDCDFFMRVEELRLLLHQWFGRLDFVTLIQDLRLHPSINLAFEKESLSRAESEVRGEIAQKLHGNEVFDMSPSTNASKKARMA
ncbi:hypothetical protein Bca101_011047 [Brassica carinata]